MKSRSRQIGCHNDFDRLLRSAATEAPVKFQSDYNTSNPKSRGFGSARDLVVRGLTAKAINAQILVFVDKHPGWIVFGENLELFYILTTFHMSLVVFEQ